MTKPTPSSDSSAADGNTDAESAAHSHFIPQLRLILRAVATSSVRRALLWLVIAVFLIVAATAYGQIYLNRWNKPFYDAMARRDFGDFLHQLGVFFVIASSLLVLNVAQRWLAETLNLKLREGLVRGLVGDWMQPRRAFTLANAGSIGVNPDQRMHEDARHLCELSAELGIGLVQASVLLVSFIGVLWLLSSSFTLHLNGHDYQIHGYMVWAAFLYAGVGSLLSYWVGRSLINRNAERYAREAELRFSLVRVNEHLDAISLAGGESGEARRVQMHLTAALAAMRRLVTGLTNLTWVTAGFGWITLVAPILVAAPLYFGGDLSFGGLMMAAAAFTQAQSSLRWFVDNFSVIADWRATLLRVADFRRALSAVDPLRDEGERITYEEGEPGKILFEELEIAVPAGRDMLRERTVQIRAGERILIVGRTGADKTLLFRALAGLWPLGSGRIVRPKDEQILYVPRGTPYMPGGTLREVLAYPWKVEQFREDTYVRALYRLGLERLASMLDQTRRWDRELGHDEQLSLIFARILVQSPPWVIVDDTFGSLDGQTLELVIDLFATELSHTGVIHVGSGEARDPLFSRVLHLVRKPAVGSPHGSSDNAAAAPPSSGVDSGGTVSQP